MTTDKTSGPTYDQFLARRPHLPKRVAEFQYNGRRLGGVRIVHRSDGLRETRLEKRSEELLVLAHALAFEDASAIFISDEDGRKEKPDFEITLDDTTIGVEVTTLRREHAAASEAVAIKLNRDVNVQLLQHAQANALLSNNIVTCRLRRAPAPKDTQKLVTEIVLSFLTCISRGMLNGMQFVPKSFETLHSYGATFNLHQVKPRYTPNLEISFSPSFERVRPEVAIGLIDSKRAQARHYGRLQELWLCVGLSDPEAQLAYDLEELAQSITTIAPFSRLHLVDSMRRLTL